jgi:hypothetical protein
MMELRRMEVELHPFWKSTLYGSQWSASRPGHLTPGKEPPPYSLNRKLGGPRPGLDALAKGEGCPSPHHKGGGDAEVRE